MEKPPAATYAGLEDRLFDLISAGGDLSDAEFSALAAEIYRFQRRTNAPYAAYCEALDAPADIDDWREIPAAPQSAFKRFDLRAGFDAAQTVRTFRTSGTTGEGYGQHHFRSLRLYEAAILAGWRHAKLPAGRPQIVLAPLGPAAPTSSLSHMFQTLAGIAPQGGQHGCFSADGGGLDAARFLTLAARLRRQARPVLLLGTALAFLHLFEALEQRGDGGPGTLPAGSEAMETGGYKGSGRTLTKAALYAGFTRWLRLPADAVFNEYGMTELSSQGYTRGLDRPHVAPPWLRALVIDPETGGAAAAGCTGVLRLFDLANLGSVLAVQTQDLAVAHDDGGRAFSLLGRDPAALPLRGCSRAADEALGG
jgi:hypothetical protein